MARVHYVKKAQQRYYTTPVLNADGTPKVTPVLRRDGTPKKTKKGREVTMRVTVADKSRPKPNIKCGKCGVEIKPGMPYKWVKTKSGPYGGATMYRCADCPSWKQSELSSSKMSGVYAAQEMLDEQIINCESVEDLQALAGDLAEMIRDVANEYEESARNIEDGFGHSTSMSEDLEQRANDLNSWADDIDNLDFDEFEGDDEDEIDCDQCDGTGKIEGENCAECDGSGKVENTAGGEEREAWLDEQRDKLSDEMGNCPV